MSIKSKEKRKCQESVQLVSQLTQNTLWESDKRTRQCHIQKRLEGQLRLRAVAVYFKVVRRSKPSSAEGTQWWRALQGYHSTLSLGPTEQTIECQRHTMVESTTGVSFHPIVRAPPPPPALRFCFNFLHF